MLSQVAGAAPASSTPLEAAAKLPAAGAASAVEDMEIEAAASSPTTESRSLVVSSTPSSRKQGGGSSGFKSSNNREFQFFYEDEVFRIDRKGHVRFGLVTDTAESYSSDDEEEDVKDVLGKGEVRVAFYPDGKEIVRAEKSIGLVDRTLMPGDVVRRCLPGQKHMSGQTGYVRDVNVRADVKVLGTKYVIRNVPSERLKPISEWSRDVPVCMGNWIGYTIDVDESAVLKSSYGTLLEITSNDFHKFKDAYGPSENEVFSPSVYYPGNVVIGRLPPWDRVTNLTPDLPLPKNRQRRSMYTVESMKTTAITVAWTFKATPQFDSGNELDPLKQPKSCIKGDDLANVKRLNIYESYMLQIHDRFYLKYSKCDKLIKYSTWEQEQAKLYQNIFQRQKSEENKQAEHNEQVKQTINITGLENTPSPSTPSGSRSAHVSKVRRLVGKFGNQRLNRSLGENEAGHTPLKMCPANSTGKKVRGNYDETWDTVDDEADEEPTHESQDTVETIESAAIPPETENATSPLNSSASQAARIVTRNFKRRSSKKKTRPSKKTSIPRKETDPKDGDDMVVETLVVYSSLTVVWQDGSVESGIPSTELYPIHHLDNHEFFPGDFVSKANDCSTSQVDYGVIQSVDHDERIAKVKWFNIYGNMDNPVPSCKDVEEHSVYDLKDHADYQYRPGTMVIRVSNFTGDDLNSTAGQVIDNFPDGRVRVWWAKGHITMCYPQDLFEIHQSDTQDAYESDESDESENSWETQSEDSRTINRSTASMDEEDHIILGIDRAKEAIQRLEKIFHVLPEKRKTDVLKDLLAVYNNCRFLDHFLKTDFFHEDYFNGILCRKKKSPEKQAVSPAAATNTTNSPQSATAGATQHNVGPEVSITGVASPVVHQVVKIDLPAGGQAASTSTPNKRKSSTHIDEVQCKKNSSSEKINVEDSPEQSVILDNITLSDSDTQLNCNELISKYRSEYTDMIKTARISIAKAIEKHKNNKNDSGVHSRGENSSSELNGPSETKENTQGENKPYILKSSSSTSIELAAINDADVCEVFCFLIKEQMAKCREAVVETFGRGKSEDKDADEQLISDADEATEISDQVMEQPLNLNGLSESLPPLESPTACSSPSPKQIVTTNNHCFEVLPNAPVSHHFIGNVIHPNNKAHYQRAIQREYAMLQASLPPGVMVRAYEDRMDLMSVMMVGPKRTPYQNALFFFDFQMGSDYPKSPPTCHYISYCTERLNPNLYEEGKVCVSLLGTWTGRDTEMWSPQSTMLQVLVSIQGLILVDEPYYNEAGYEKQRGTQLGNENSRVYNEMAIIKIVHSTVKQLLNPPLVFRKELIEHFKEFGTELHGRMKAWSEYSAEAQRLKITSINDMPKDYITPCDMPEFPLLPCSRGFCIAVKGVLETLQNELGALERNQINEPVVATAPRAAPEDV